MLRTRAEDIGRWKYPLVVAGCTLTTVLAMPLRAHFDLANIVMLFLLTVLLVARYLGLNPALLAAFLSVALFDFFFVPPQLSFTVNDAQYLVTFTVMLATALITGTLTAGLRREADQARERERQTQALYEMARDLAGAIAVEQVAETMHRFLKQAVAADAALLLPDPTEKLRLFPGDTLPRVDIHLAYMALEQAAPVECDSLAADGYAIAYYGLLAPTRPRGVLAVAPHNRDPEGLRAQRALLETVASLVAIALERLHYVAAAQRAEVAAASEHLRASLLSALSHDLRTPLTALRGTAETLAITSEGRSRELAEDMRDQAIRLSRMVTNLLDMARLHAGKVVLRKDWQALQEVVGSSLKLLEPALSGREVRIDIPAELPLLEFDPVLIERVLCNLIENAIKYSPAGTQIEITAHFSGSVCEVAVCDEGCGFPAGREEAVFALFERGTSESPVSGFGLGLAICRAIVEAHGGRIVAQNRPAGGACVSFTLPVGVPPEVLEESDAGEEERHG